jgi:trans-aconitate 2-methyltransferase
MPEWDSAQYLRFERERTQPCRDLAARIEFDAPASIVDLGCGPGNSTEVIAARFPEAAITGLDSSAALIETARSKHPDWNWADGEIGEWASGSERYDLLFSNAALQFRAW